jgi:hypothetical protein
MFSQYTTYLANRLCGGSSRKLIAGWWYSILAMTISITLISLTMMNQSHCTVQERIIALWSSLLLCCFSIGGTMIMRKFHNSIAVGFFMGVTVTSCQYFISLSFLFFHFRYIQLHQNNEYNNNSAKEETLLACMSAIQAILLGSFAIILAAHRTEILDKPLEDDHHPNHQHNTDITTTTHINMNQDDRVVYQPPPPPSSSSSSRSQHHVVRA